MSAVCFGRFWDAWRNSGESLKAKKSDCFSATVEVGRGECREPPVCAPIGIEPTRRIIYVRTSENSREFVRTGANNRNIWMKECEKLSEDCDAYCLGVRIGYISVGSLAFWRRCSLGQRPLRVSFLARALAQSQISRDSLQPIPPSDR